MRIKKGDQVRIISGKDKGKSGKVLRVVPKSLKVVIEGLNVVKKHSKPKKGGEKGQRIEIPSPISISKVMLVCPKCGKAVRTGYNANDEIKSRICKKCKSEI
jgi:large subunit ribosomal protein L24